MDRPVGTLRNHARRYRELLDTHWEQTDWTRPQAEQVLGRMDQVLEPLPAARQQARQRILKGQLVPNEKKIFNAICPRSPGQLRQRNRSWKFKRMQKRRAQTEGRIGIVKNVFLGGWMRCKGFEHRELTVTWTVLVHNLWVLARLPRVEKAEAARPIFQTQDRGRGVYRRDRFCAITEGSDDPSPLCLMVAPSRISDCNGVAKTRPFGTGSI